MTRKYGFTGRTRVTSGIVLRQITALRDFGTVMAGTPGGYIGGEDNLSHEGLCWVAENACVWGSARVEDDARVGGSARVYGNAVVRHRSSVGGNAYVYGDTVVDGDAAVDGKATLSGNDRISGTDLQNTPSAYNGRTYGRGRVETLRKRGWNDRLDFGRYTGLTVRDVFERSAGSRAYLVWCFACIERFDLTDDVIGAIFGKSVPKPAAGSTLYADYVGSLPEDERRELGRSALIRHSKNNSKAVKSRKRALRDIEDMEDAWCSKARLQAYNHGHTRRS